MKFELENIREDFPALLQTVRGKPLIYLDSAATTLKPKGVIDSINRHYTLETANVHRGVHYLSEQATINFERTRTKVKEFIGAESEKEIIFTKGTTESINLIASSYGGEFLNPGDEILLSTMEHHSNIVPWQLIAERKGAKVIEVPINDRGEIILEEYTKLLGPKTKIVSIAHISNTLGTINPIEEMIELAHQNSANAIFVVDAAQSISHMSIDVKKIDCDFFVFSAHKMFGPTGVGVLYGKEALLEKMPPYQGGGAMIEKVTFAKTTYNELPEKFEAGTPHIAGVITLFDALEYVERIGFSIIYEQEKKLLDYATSGLSRIEGLKIIGTAKEKTSVISFVMEGVHPHDLGTLLDQQGVAIRTGHHCTQPLMQRFNIPATARASFCFYNNLNDVNQLVCAIRKAREML